MHDGIQGNVATIDTHEGQARAIRAKLRLKCSLTLRKRGQALSIACEIQTPIDQLTLNSINSELPSLSS